jgi:hypothetical protein
MRIDSLVCAAMMGGLAMAGCHSTGGAAPARLSTDSDSQMQQLKAGLSEAVGRANVELGAGDPMGEGSVVVLPPRLGPLETSSTARPVIFDLELRGEMCFAVNRETGEAFELPGVDCRAKD